MNYKTSDMRTYEKPDISIESLYVEQLMQNFSGGDDDTGIIIGEGDTDEDEPQRVAQFNTSLWEDQHGHKTSILTFHFWTIWRQLPWTHRAKPAATMGAGSYVIVRLIQCKYVILTMKKACFFIKSVFFTLFFKKKNVFLHTFQKKYYLCPKLDAYQFICT